MATGHLRKRQGKNGTVSYQITVEGDCDPVSGKRDRQYRTVQGTKKQAEAAMRKLIEQMENGGVLAESSLRLGEWMLEWLDTYLPNIEATTRASYREQIQGRILPVLGHIPLKALRTASIQSWVNAMREEEGLSPKRIRNVYMNLNAALNKAVVLKMIPHNPCIGVELPKAIKPKLEVYDDAQIAQLIEAARETDMYLLILLALAVGMRRGEQLALRWEDVDLQTGVIHIRRNMVIAGGKITHKAPKTASGVRDVTVGQDVLRELRAAHGQYAIDKLAKGKGFSDLGYVIHKKDGAPFRPESITRKWKRFLAAKGLKDIPLHGLRHTNATAQLAAGVDYKTVSERLGHADVSITMNIYAHRTAAMDQNAAKKLDSVLFPTASNQ